MARAFPGYEGVSIGDYGMSTGGAVSGVTLSGWARQNSEDRPHGVTNDYIASTLGLILGLPVAPVALVALGGGAVASVSLGFGERGVQPPPADLERLADEHPQDVAGIVVFDQWVLNTDRHDENLASLPAHGMVAFDHDAAVIGFKPPDSALKNLEAGHDAAVKSHCLAPYVADWSHLEQWVALVQGVSPVALRRVVERTFHARLINASERDAIVSMLTYRANRIGDMIESREDDFTRITQRSLPGGEQQ
jgi:hypothetical protein